ncbi:SMI1/KNR4 family protein [Pedobacter nyackensis]|uniref:SMI1-KNR4 cell-wall n=1 Tax=Pedobacter nyackensis TaxID=475255 RepID=A0A1W2AJI7_9SPHI|nr:SMI1/KNR4 family protein [Pedobacter nyackensis]SMC60847.1 SMI1-KNR4 cell-wall [Pedobacter nyackensis]
METFERILVKHNCVRRTDKPIAHFEDIENIIGFKLPPDYRLFLETYCGFEEFIGEAYVRLWGMDEIIDQNQGYGVFENLPATLAIGGNGGGEFIAITIIDEGNYRIVISPFIDLNEEYHVEIGSSFTDFLERLNNGHGYFDNIDLKK